MNPASRIETLADRAMILVGDCRDVLCALPAQSIHCGLTSPPYYRVRDYKMAEQIGLEETPEQYIGKLVDVFREFRRVLRDDGVLWVNIGDSYATGGARQSNAGGNLSDRDDGDPTCYRPKVPGLKPKDLIGIPWMLAFAMRADGWYWRGDNHACTVWAKPNGMPESTQDRPTRSHEVIHLFTKSRHYFYNAAAVRTVPAMSTVTRLQGNIAEQNGSARGAGGTKTMKAVGCGTLVGTPHGRHALGDEIPETERRADKQRGHSRRHAGFNDRWDSMDRSEQMIGGANLRSVWWLSPASFSAEFCTACRRYFDGAALAALHTETIERDGRKIRRRYCVCGSYDKWLSHFAVMPDMLAEICILAGCPQGGTVLDMFGGVGTTALVAGRLQRKSVTIELNQDYAEMAEARIRAEDGIFASVCLQRPAPAKQESLL